MVTQVLTNNLDNYVLQFVLTILLTRHKSVLNESILLLDIPLMCIFILWNNKYLKFELTHAKMHE